MPLFEIKGKANDIPDEQKVPMAMILALHRERWDFVSSLGTMRLKRLTILDQEATIIKLEREHPEYFVLQKEASELWHMADKGVCLNPEQQEQLNGLVEKLQPFAHEFSVGCFEEPKLKDGSELGMLLFELQPYEREELLTKLSILANPSPDGKVETVGLMLAKEFGIKLSNDLTVENMTSVQATALTRHIIDSRGGGDG
jgi:hypothetical protein